jgi:hypothetical protein
MHVMLPGRGVNSTDKQNKPSDQAVTKHHCGCISVGFRDRFVNAPIVLHFKELDNLPDFDSVCEAVV